MPWAVLQIAQPLARSTVIVTARSLKRHAAQTKKGMTRNTSGEVSKSSGPTLNSASSVATSSAANTDSSRVPARIAPCGSRRDQARRHGVTSRMPPRSPCHQVYQLPST